MKRPYCEVFVKYVLPALRALIAELLMERYSLTQAEAAKLLGVTQPAVSNYLRKVRGTKLYSLFKKSPKVTEFAETVAKILISGRDFEDWCKGCELVRCDEKIMKELSNMLSLELDRLIIPPCAPDSRIHISVND